MPLWIKYSNNDPFDEVFKVGMFSSDGNCIFKAWKNNFFLFLNIEPGYYEAELNFGIRLETDIEVIEANTVVFIYSSGLNFDF